MPPCTMPPRALSMVGVLQQYHGVLAAHLALNFFQVLGPLGVDAGADFRGAGEGYCVHVRALYQGGCPPTRLGR